MKHIIVISSNECIKYKKEIANAAAKVMGFQILDPYEMMITKSKCDDYLGIFLKSNWTYDILIPMARDMVLGSIQEGKSLGYVIVNFIESEECIEDMKRIFPPLHEVCILHLGSMNEVAKILSQKYPNLVHFIDMNQELYKAIDKVDEVVCQDSNFGVITSQAAEIKYNPDFGKKCVPGNFCESAIVLQACFSLSESEWQMFPGTHPVNVTKKTIQSNLQKYPYLVSKKIDGTRYIMVILGNRMWFINRKLQVWKGPSSSHLAQFNHSVIDVEVQKKEIVIIDVINIHGLCVRSWNLMKRLATVSEFVKITANSPLPARMQHYGNLEEIPEKIDPECDGLIFTPKKTSYRLGRNGNLLKWKPAHKNTIDFVYSKHDSRPLYGAAGSYLAYGCAVRGVPECVPDGAIIECIYDTKTKDLHFYRERKDKSNPNTLWVIENIMESVRDDILLDDLRTAICHDKVLEYK